MRARRLWRSLVGLALILAGSSPAALRAHEASFSVSAVVESLSLDAQIEAAGRLRMLLIRERGGAVTYRLERVLEAPWKLYAVDPLGPTGDEIKLAAVVTLDEPTWDEVERTQEETKRFGEERYRAWRDAGRVDRPFDGAYAFTVIGDPRGRFGFRVEPDGAVSRVENRLTHRWLGGRLDPLLDTWRRTLDQGRTGPEGYWFWNEGETEPFEWEPHTYHAFAAALELLGRPAAPAGWRAVARPDGPTAVGAVDYPNAVAAARGVFETLVPKAEGRLSGRGSATLRVTAHPLGGGAFRLEAESGELPVRGGRGDGGFALRRTTTLDPDGAVLADRLAIRVTSGGAELSIEVGHGDEDGARSPSQER